MRKDRPIKAKLPKEVDLAQMFRMAMTVCGRAGYPIHDPEYGSVINEAVLTAANTWEPGLGCKPTTLASIYAKRLCKQVKVYLQDSHKFYGERQTCGNLVYKEPLEPIEISKADSALLEFVALYGLTGASCLLRKFFPRKGQLRERLDGIRLRILLQRLEQ